MKVLISGSSRGIGKAVALRLLSQGFTVYGLDLLPSSIDDGNYHHYQCDIKDKNSLPDIDNLDYLFNNAGLQNSENDITNNLIGTINVTEKYGYQDNMKAILFNASASAISGDEFPLYVASKGGLIAYMRHIAIDLAPSGVLVNALSLGGVIDEFNIPVMDDKELFNKIMDVTPLKKWMTLEEVCDWVEFILLKNKSMSGENILIDNGEYRLNSHFVWPEE